MGEEIKGSEAYLTGLYPLLEPGVLCRHRGELRQWVGFRLRQRPGFIFFEGRYSARILQNNSMWTSREAGSTTLGWLQTCGYRKESITSVSQERICEGFELIEDSIQLEALVQRGDLAMGPVQPPHIRDAFEKMLQDLRFGWLATEDLIPDVPWY